MAKEIERKYLVLSEAFKASATAIHHIEQAYLSVRPTVRLRLRDDEAFITIKGKSNTSGLSRDEWEYSIPLAEAREMMSLAIGQPIIKERYIVPYAGKTWEVDVFHGAYEGLMLAELELLSEDESFERPAWLGEEVTGITKYYNTSMALKPR